MTAAHGEPGHVHDEACAAAHGQVQPPADPRPLVLVFDAPVAHECARLAERLGWPVTVVDDVDALAVAGVDEHTDVVVCDHERPELGDLLARVLSGPVRWVGVMGSLRHTAPHVQALRERGVAEELIARVHRPIGLDVGSRTPPEIALSTVAGLLADRNGRSGGPFPPAPAA